MAIAVTTVTSGGLLVTDVTATHPSLGLHVAEVTKYGLAITKGPGGLPVNFAPVQDWPAGGGGAAATATFNGVASTTTLSNGNLTATNAGGTTVGGARSAASKTTGLYYFEVTMTSGSGNGEAIGIITDAGTYANMGGGGINCSEVIRVNGVIFSNNTVFANPGLTAVANGTVVCWAVNLTTRRAWARKGAGLWNADGGADPVAGTGGMTLAATVGFAPAVTFGGAGGVNGSNMTANFGATAFAHTAPAGFGNWTA